MAFHRTRSFIPALASGLLLPGTVLAQATIEEIVVTATKRAESVQDISVAVTALTGDQLTALGITDAFRLDTMAPGLQMGLSGADPRPAMRGARTQQVEANDVAVSFYTDNIYRPRHGQAMAGFVDVERVEVLRGPQGTLFGRNSFGGLIHVISRKPDPDAMDFGGALTVGDYNRVRAEGFFNAPMGDTTALRIAAVREMRDPYVENITIGDAGGLKDADTSYVRGLLSIAPSDNWDLTLRAEYWKDGSNGNGAFGYKAVGVPVNLTTGLTNGVSGTMRQRIGRSDECAGTCGRAGAGMEFINDPSMNTVVPTIADPYKIADDTDKSRDLDETTLGADFNMGFSFADLKIMLAYMDYAEFRWDDCDLSPNAAIQCGNDITSKTSMQEIQLTSNSDGRLGWVAGAFFLQEDLENAFLWKDIATLVDNVPVTPPDLNTFASWAQQIRVDTKSAAVYGEANFAVTDTVRLIAGLRYTNDDRDWQIFGQDPNDLSQPIFNQLTTPDGTGTWEKVTWKAGVEWDLGDASMTYATVSTGFLAGNQQGAFNGTSFYDEQLVTAYEVGSKNVLADGTLQLNASLYYNEFEDLLATRFVDTGATTLAFTDNAGAIEALGLEVEADWVPTDEWFLSARLAFQNAEYGDFVNPNVYQEGGQTINGIDNLFQLNGLQVQNSPDVTATIIANYAFRMSSGAEIVPAVTVFYSDNFRVDDSPWSYGNQDSFTRSDVSVAWRSPEGLWTVRAFVYNIEDEAVLLKATRFGGDLAVVDYGAPRTMGVMVGYNY